MYWNIVWAAGKMKVSIKQDKSEGVDPCSRRSARVARVYGVVRKVAELTPKHNHISHFTTTTFFSSHTTMAADLQAIAGQLQASLDPQQSRQGEFSPHNICTSSLTPTFPQPSKH
jgi:hypothetical protein